MRRFATVEDEKKQQILTEKDAINTQKAARLSYKLFINYCEEKQINMDIFKIFDYYIIV